MTKRKDGATSFRLPSELLAELDAEVAIFATLPEYQAMRVTRSVVINMALAEWLRQRKTNRTP